MNTRRNEIPDWLELSRSEAVKDRRRAVHALCPCVVKSHSREVWQRMLQMIDDPDAGVRRAIVHALCDGSPAEYAPEIVKALEARYHDPDDSMRKMTRRMLAAHRRTGALNIL
ncbi:MAG TPA: HEAT repeat domain-containing protein [Candidatus Binataceae bacterium]|nr:HEAT repeat domain-containing protein [Candidatus Binataceae bacterium]